MTALSTDSKHATVEAQVKASAVKLKAVKVPGRSAEAGVARTLKKISEDSNADLFSGKAAHAAFSHILS
jgi:hypothetical protein